MPTVTYWNTRVFDRWPLHLPACKLAPEHYVWVRGKGRDPAGCYALPRKVFDGLVGDGRFPETHPTRCKAYHTLPGALFAYLMAAAE
jgi:hypothetical protein